jgi:hypothetical protein
MSMTAFFRKYRKLVVTVMGAIALFVFLTAETSGCQGEAQRSQTNQTQTNLTQINGNQHVPDITYPQRLQVLFDFYGQVLNKPRLRTCTLITSRGGVGSSQDAVIGAANSLGMPVNMSNQTTATNDAGGQPQPEPDGIYPGTNDQTAVILRNGRALVTEADTTAITGDCDPSVHPNTFLQREIDYIQSLPPARKNDPETPNLCAEAHC